MNDRNTAAASTLAVVLPLVALAAVAALGAFAQNQPQPIPRFRTGVEGVVLDVVVLDRNRRPVRGLTADDFTILEDGVRQAVTAFTAIDIPDVVEPSSPWVHNVAPDVRRNDDIADRRVVVLVLDDLTAMPAEEVQHARRLARAAIEHLGPDDLTAVVHAFNRRASQGFTTDRGRLLASIDKFNGSIPMATMDGGMNAPVIPGSFTSMGSNSPTLLWRMADTLREIADYLADLPQRRKILLYVSVGIPMDISLAQAAVPGAAGMDASGIMNELIQKVRDAIRAAERSNVSIYGLDPGGLRGGLSGAEAVKLNLDFLIGLSDSTGGFAVTNTNDPGPDLAQIVRENGSYYLLGYQPTNKRSAGTFRKVRIRVNRPGVTVRSRSGYYESRPEKGPEATAGQKSETSLLRAAGAFAPQGDLAMQATAAPFVIPGRQESAVAIVVSLAQPAPAGANRAVETVKLRVHAYDPGGTQRGAERLDARVVLRPNAVGEATYELLARLDLKPGRYELRIAAESALRQKTGSVFYDLDVPDFSKGTVSLSGLVMGVAPGVAGAPRDKLAALLPIVPTSQREFGVEDKVTAFVRVYQPSKKSPLAPVGIGVTLLDAAGATVLDRRETLAVDRFGAARSADYQVDLPIASLARGPHLLTIEASQGKTTASRQVPIRVR